MTSSEKRAATLRAVADVLVPSGGPFPLGATDVDAGGRLARQIDRFPPVTRRQVDLLVRIFECGPLLSKQPGWFSRLSPAARQAYLERALESRLPWKRLPAQLLKQLVLLAFGATHEFESRIGFDHSCVASDSPREGPHLHPIEFPQIRGTVDVHADAVVVGSGAGGATVAAELAEAGLSVVVVEEGPYYTRTDFRGAPFERVLRLYRDQGTTAAFGRSGTSTPVPLGKAVGGTTVINSGTCFRTPDRVLRAWESTWSIEGIDPASMAPLFDRVESILRVKPVPWEIIGENARLFDRGVRAMGLRGAPIRRNIDGCRGCGVCAFGCPSDAKQAAHLSYLPRAEARGAAIYARCRVRRILVERGRAGGIEAEIFDGADEARRGMLRVRAPIVVVAAGAIHTPVLLANNRLARQSRQLGRNLRIHPALAVTATFPEEIRGWRGTMQSYFVDSIAESHDVMIEVTNPIPGLAVAQAPGIGPRLKDEIASLPRMASAGLFVSDTSAGRVLRGAGARPWILYSLNQRDADRLIAGIDLVSRIFFEAGADSVQTGLPGMPEVTHPRQLGGLARYRIRSARLHTTGFHPMGTCRMGRDPAHTVVDDRGAVHGVDGLYIADASVFPSCVGVNPQISIMAFATRIAHGIARVR